MDLGLMLHHIFNDKRFSTLFENASIGIVVADSDGNIEDVNKYVLTEFGYAKKDLLHQKVEFLIPERLRAKHEALRAAYSKKPASLSIPAYKNLKGLRKDGTEFLVEMSIGYYDDNGDTYYIAFINELSRKKEAQETIKLLIAELDQRVKESTRSLNATVDQLSRQIKENERKDAVLVKALEREKELNELKSRFVSVASHEFRTPLSGVLASTYLLSKYTKGEEQPQRDKHIKRIISSVNLLNEVLGDLLSIDKIEQGDFKPNLTHFNINTVVNEIIQSMQHMLKKGQNISLAYNGETGIAYIDQSMFQHIITNLLSNAIKYSPENSPIDIIIDQEDPTIIIKVKDHGIGIPKEDQGKLFKRFFRSSNAAHIEGTGLGLNIVKKYVEVMDGTITYASELNKGTEFVITFNNQKEHYENDIDS